MGKLKRNICRFLIVLQIYGNVFQGAAHAADLADNNGIRNHIHLASFIDQTGNRRLALGTDGEDGRFTFLKSIDVPSSDTLDLPIKKVSTELLDGISDTTSVNGDDEDDDNPILGSDDGSSTTASIGGKGYFKSKTIVYEPQGNYLTLQGLKIYIDHDGAMRLEGRQNLEQDKHRKPIFLSSDESITLDSVMAHELILNAPQLNNYNKSLIGYLGIGSDESHFTNFGDMTIINLAEGRAFEVMDNHRVMTIDHGSVKARTFNNSGTFGLKQGSLMAENGTNAGWFKADSLDVGTDFTNEEDGVVITPSVSGAGELINLGKIETLEDLSLNVKNFSNSAGGSVTAKSITGLTNLKKFTNAEDASIDAGQALVFADNTKVINQGGMQANAMTLYGGQTTNGSSGRIDTTTLNLLGESEFENKGDIDVDQDLYLSLSGFTNKGGASLETGRIYGYEHLITLQNDSGSLFKVRDGPLALAKTTELINAGTIEAQSLDLSSALTTIRKSGIFRAPSINLTGVNPFTNHGHILANQKLKLNLPEFINLQRIESPSIDISQVTKLTNAKKAVIDAQGSDLSFGKDAKVINDGNLKARDYTFDGGSLAQGGHMDGRSLKLRDTAVTTTDDQIINLLGSLEESSTNSWAIRGKINAYHYIRVGDISLYGTLNLVNFFEGRGTIHPGGKLITAHASFYNDLSNHGGLIAKQSASFTKGLTIAQNGFALLHDLRAAGDITNHGKLQIVGIQQPNQNAIKLTNSGIASFDANQTIPIVKKDQPQNLAWLDCEQATKADNYLNACFEFFNGTTAGKDFLKESAWLPSQITKVEPIEQYRLWYHEKYRLWYKNEYAEHLRQAVTAEKYQQWYQKVYQAPLEVSDLVTETVAKRLATISEKREAREQSWQVLFATTKPIKLQLDNQTTGKLTLRSGQFSFAGNNALVNEGTLTQDRAYVHWRVDSLDGLSGGIWQAKGSLGLLAYTGYNVGKLGVEENLHVSASRNSNFTDGIQVLEGLKQCKAQKVIVYADKIKNELTTSSPVKKSYPWPLELRINGDIDNSLEISAPELSIYAHNLKTLANLFASLGLLHLDVENLLDIEALIFGKKAISAKAQQFKIFGREDIPGRFNPRGKCYEHGVHYKLNGNGAYSEGRITLNISGLINNYYGTIQGSAYTITTPQLTNLAGLIAAIDPQANSQINVKDLKNLRDAQAGNQAHFECWSTSVLLNSDIGRPRDFGLPCAVGNHYHETSDEAVIASNGDLIINYHTLEMLISSITSYANLTLFANGVSLRNPGEGDMLPGTTTMTKRNWQINRIVGKAGIKADLGNANMATSMYGENIRVKAAWLTLQSLGLTPQQQIQIYDLVTECFNNNAYKNKNGNIDTVMPWKKSRAPKVMVVLGEKAIEQMGSGEPIKSQISLEAIEQQTKNLFFRFNRGIDGMGSNINDFFNNAFVRNHPDTISQQGTITLGGRAHKIEYLFNSTLTAQDVLKQGERDAFAYLQLKYEENLNTLKAEDRVSAFLENASVKMVTNSESQGNRCLKGEQNLEIDVENDANIATSIEAINVLVKAKGNIIISSDIIHYQPNGGGDHWQVLDQTKIKAVKISLEAGKNINFKAVNTNSKVETRFIAKGHIIDETVGLSSKKTWQNEDGWHCYKSVQQQVSKHESGDKIISTANGAQHLFATNFKCKTLVLTGNDGVDLYEVHDITEYEHRSETAGNAFKNKVTKISQDKYHTGKGVKFDLEEGRVITNGDANFRNVGGKGKVTIELRGKKSNLKIFQGTNYRSHANFTKDEGTFWQSVELKGSNHSTFSEPDWLGEYIVQTKNFEDPVTGLFEVAEVDEDKFDEDSINSVSVNDELKKQVIIQQVHGQAISYMHRIKIDDGGEFVFENVHEKHEYYHEAQDGPTAAFAATFALAITALTYGAGADLGALVVSSTTATCGTTAAGILGGMATGAFMSVCAQTSMALLLNGGDPSKAAKSLVSKESFRNLIFSTVSGGIKGYMGKSPTGFINKLAFNLDRNIVESGLRLVMFNEKFDFISCLRNAGLDTVAEIGANKIGDRYENNKIDGPTRDIYHFGLAASIQSITDLSQNNGFKLNNTLNAGFSAVLAHKVGEGINPTTARVLIPFLAFLLRENPNIASRAGQNAIDHNLLADHQADPNTTLAEDIKERMEIPEGQEGTPEQIAYEQGLCAYVMDNLDKARRSNGRDLSADQFNHVIESSRDKYAQTWTYQKGFEMLGNSVVGASEWLIPGLEGTNQAWMATVNYYRGDLTKHEWKTEVYNGYKSVSVDGTICVTTMGVGNTIKPAMKAASKFIKFFKMPKTPIQTIKPVFGETLSTLKTKMGTQKESINQIDLIGKKLPANRNNMQPINSNRQMPWLNQATGTDCLGHQRLTTQNLADNINKPKSNNIFQQKKEFHNPSDHQSNNIFQQKPTLQNPGNNYSSSNKPRVENVLTHRIDGSKIPDTQIGSKQVSQSFNKAMQKSEIESSLDWSRYSNRTKGSADHHIKMNHGQLRLDKEQQSVFYGDPIKTVENSWEVVKQKNIAPIRQDYADIYIIPKSNVGYDGGIGGQRTNLNYITLVVEKETKKVITAYPSGATPSLPKDYLPFTTDFSKVQK